MLAAVRSRLFTRTLFQKGKGKGRLWVLQHCCLGAYFTRNRM